jgi:hypothetical protein
MCSARPVSSRIRLGLIGCGSIGKIHASCLARIPEAELAACSDASPEAAHALAEDHECEYSTPDPARIFGDPSIQATRMVLAADAPWGIPMLAPFRVLAPLAPVFTPVRILSLDQRSRTKLRMAQKRVCHSLADRQSAETRMNQDA